MLLPVGQSVADDGDMVARAEFERGGVAQPERGEEGSSVEGTGGHGMAVVAAGSLGRLCPGASLIFRSKKRRRVIPSPHENSSPHRWDSV